MRIKRAESAAEIEEVRHLFREYEVYLDADLCFQNFDQELTNLPGKYALPTGDLIIGMTEDKIVGCVASS